MNHLKFCSCRGCLAGRHKGKIKTRPAYLANRKLRHTAKIAVRTGREPDRLISVPYTD